MGITMNGHENAILLMNKTKILNERMRTRSARNRKYKKYIYNIH